MNNSLVHKDPLAKQRRITKKKSAYKNKKSGNGGFNPQIARTLSY